MSNPEFKPFLTPEAWEKYWLQAKALEEAAAQLLDRDDLVLGMALRQIAENIVEFGKMFRDREISEFNRFYEGH